MKSPLLAPATPHLLAAFVMVAFAPAARADVPAILSLNQMGAEVSISSFAGFANGGNVGWAFTVGASPIALTQLGLYDSGVNGLAESHRVGLWADGGGTPLAQTTIFAGTGSPILGLYRYESVAPVTLNANTTYVVGALYGVSSPDRFLYFTQHTFAPGIAYGQSRESSFSSNPTFGYPNISAGVDQGFFGPSFQIAEVGAVPEPGSIALLGACLLPFIGAAARRRCA